MMNERTAAVDLNEIHERFRVNKNYNERMLQGQLTQ